ncbi:spore coat U domain-containing protein [Caballeronia calidae]|uniref:Spore coat U domain-containing protein n=1 Tax=Caballeronia calidae TaxID=1777139 RepID=A0A158EHH2_9BURK|nr:spore coat U domain-containing protein [Caballeronia calidae]SAL06243.1 spore coat U domain-containing protein [Caballeronia calidae]
MNTHIRIFQLSLLGVIAATGLVVPSAKAGTDTANLTVKIVITSTCDIHTAPPTDVNFGTVSSTATNIAQAGSITANCTPGTTYQISLDNGLNASGGQRRMAQGSNFVAYNLYTDSAHANTWSTGASAYSGSGAGSAQVIPVYGVVPSANAQAGTYTDTVVATISY